MGTNGNILITRDSKFFGSDIYTFTASSGELWEYTKNKFKKRTSKLSNPTQEYLIKLNEPKLVLSSPIRQVEVLTIDVKHNEFDIITVNQVDPYFKAALLFIQALEVKKKQDDQDHESSSNFLLFNILN